MLAILLTAFLAGCAMLPPPQTPKPAMLPEWSSYVSQINGTDYLPINTLAQRYQITTSWEPATQVLQLSSGSVVVRVSPGFSVAVVNGVAQPLGAPVVSHQGILWVPAQAAAPWITVTPAPPPPVPTGRYAIRTVVLDPGHGGRDPGAIGASGVREKQVVLDIARQLRRRLEADGIQVLMTRSDDRFISLKGRAAFANQQKADLFVSIHANASRARNASGYEVYYLSEATDDAARALAVAENASLSMDTPNGAGVSEDTEAIVWDLIHTENRTESRELASTVCRGMKRSLPAYNRGVKSARFYVLKWTQMPSVLIEVGFVTNRTEGSRLQHNSYRDAVAEGIAHGLLAYRQVYERTNGFSN